MTKKDKGVGRKLQRPISDATDLEEDSVVFFSRQIWVRVFRLKTRAPNWPARRPKTRLLLERLEDRMLLSSTILQETQGDLAQSVYGVTGKGVAIAILDRVLALK